MGYEGDLSQVKHPHLDSSRRSQIATKVESAQQRRTAIARRSASNRGPSKAKEASTRIDHSLCCAQCRNEGRTADRELRQLIRQLALETAYYRASPSIDDRVKTRSTTEQIAAMTLGFTILCVLVGLFSLEMSTYQANRKNAEEMLRLRQEFDESRRLPQSTATAIASMPDSKKTTRKKPLRQRRPVRRVPVV
jgi:alkylhydroperoxidase family enzyme